MFLTTHRPTCTWTFTEAGRGKRSAPTALGFYVIEHLPTGKLWVGWSRRVSQDVDEAIGQLLIGTHPCKALNRLVQIDAELKLYEYPTMGLAQAKDLVKQLKPTVEPSYLLLNP